MIPLTRQCLKCKRFSSYRESALSLLFIPYTSEGILILSGNILACVNQKEQTFTPCIFITAQVTLLLALLYAAFSVSWEYSVQLK